MSRDIEILIVEENLAESEHLRHILEQHEYRVTVEHNGKAALDAARANSSRIVISDVALPEMNGERSAIEKAQTANSLGSEELLGFMLESAKDYSIFTTDAEGRVTSWNAGAEHFFGYSEAEILGQNGAILFTPEDREIGALEQELSTAVTEGRATDERWHLRKDGTRFWMSGMVSPHRDDAGQLRGFIKIGRNLTERKQAEEALRRRELELSDFVDNATIGLQWIDGDGIIKWANKTELDLLGYKPEEYIGHHIAEFYADQEVIENILERLMGDEALNDQEARLRCKDGTFRNVLINSNVFWEDGKFVHTRCYTRDITERKLAQDELRKAHNELEQRVEKRTAQLKKANEKLQSEINERKRAEEKLREKEEWLRAIFDASRDGLLVENDGKIVFINNSYAAMLGYDTTEELLGKDVSVLLSLDDSERMTAYGKARLRGETPPTYYEFKVKRKDGSLVDSEANIATAVIGGTIHIITAVRDITERKQAEVSLRQSEANLAAAQRISHLGSWELDILDLEDASKNPVHCSDEVYRIFGYEPGQIEVTGEVFYSFVRSHERTRISEALFETVKQRKDLNIEFSIVLPDGREPIVHVQAEVVYDEQSNKPSKLIGTIQDITERKQAEKQAHEATERFRFLAESMPQKIFTARPNGEVDYFNHQWMEYTGLSFEQIKDWGWTQFIHPEDVEENVRSWRHSIETGELFQVEHRYRQADGEYRWHLSRAHAMRGGSDDKVLMWIGSNTDIHEHKLAQEALKVARLQLETALNAGAIATWDYDILNNRIVADKNMAQLFSVLPEDAAGGPVESYLRAIHPDDRQHVEEYLAKAITSANNYEINYRIIKSDGTIRWVEVRGQIERNEIGTAARMLGVIIDTTERKLAEQTVHESEARYRVVTESASDAIVTIDVENTIIFINPAAEKMFGYALDEMLGNNLSMLMPEKFRGAHTAGIKRYAATGKRNILWQGVEVSALHKDGHEVPVEITFGELNLDVEQLFTAVIRDITDRKLAREALEKSERQYRFLSEGIMHQVWTARPDGKLDYVNGRTLKYFGLTFEQMINDGWQSVVHPDDLADCLKRWTKSLETGEYYEVEFRLKKADGSYRWHSGCATAGRDSEGKIVKWFGTNTDINDKKLAEEELNLSEERLQLLQKMEAIGTLTGGVAHDFNNLLTAILGNTQLAQRKLAPDDAIQLRLTEIADAGNRAAELTRKLLAFSHRQHLERRTVNLNNIIGEIMTLLERIIGEDVEMSVKYGSDLPTVFADSGQIGQVVMNLAVNARDAMPSGGKLTIETSCVELDESYCLQYPYVLPGRYVQIRISDSGTGMDEETQARIFEPYFTTKEVGKGTGLGLSMAYGIIRQHDGHINLYSESGLGTTFKVYLPVDKKIVEEKVPAILPSFLGGTETILVAEDEKPLRNLAKDTLEELGYTVLLAKNGEEAVEVFGANRERIDLFLSDVVMPQMGGSEAYERIREMGGNVPLIFMTGYSSETVQSRFAEPKTTAEQLGAAVIQKPYSLEQLGRTVREVLDKNHKP